MVTGPVSMQQSVQAWAAHNIPANDPAHQALNVAEEAGELCRAVLKRVQGIRGTREQWTAEVRKEAADVVLSLYNLAIIEGFDLDEAVRERWQAVEQRDWVSDPVGHGVGGDGPV